MSLRFLGKGGSTNNGCPTLLTNDSSGYIVQAWKTNQADTVELPHLVSYSAFGKSGGWAGALTTDPYIAEYCRRLKERFWPLAVPYREYVTR